MSTDLNSEFTHFNLVIRLSKVQQLALQLCTILRSPAGPAVPLIPTERISIEWSRAEHSETSYFAAAFAVTLHHFMSHVPGRHTTFRCGLFLLMVVWWGQIYCAPNSMELESCFMPIGARLDHGPGAGNNRTTSRKLGTESCFNFLWFHQLIPIGPLSHAFFPPQVGWLRRVSRAEVFVGFRCVRLVQALSSSPPPLVLFRVRRPSAFLFPCLSRACPLRARCVVLVFSPSSFAFPSSRPG